MPKHAGGILIAALVALTAGTGAAAADGWYYREGVGVMRLERDLDREFTTGDAPLGVRAAAGRRVGDWSVEAFLLAGQMQSRRFDNDLYSALGYGLDARYHVPLASHVELYLRGGLGGLALTGGAYRSGPDLSGYGGRALQYGAGVQVGGQVRALGLLFWPFFFTKIGPKVTAAAFFDTGA